MTPRVREILSWYSADCPGVVAHLARVLNSGLLAGRGKVVLYNATVPALLGPAQSTAMNPDGYDPQYHFRMAKESGCSALVAPLGMIEDGARDFAGEVPLVLHLNPGPQDDSFAGVVGSVQDALRLGCSGIAVNLSFQSSGFVRHQKQIVQQMLLAKKWGLFVVAEVRGLVESVASNGDGQSEFVLAVDQMARGCQLACQWGAHMVVSHTPTASLANPLTKKILDAQQVRVKHLGDLVKHVAESCFNGRRILLFGDQDFRGSDEFLDEHHELASGGSLGVYLGVNGTQRPRLQVIELLEQLAKTYTGDFKK